MSRFFLALTVITCGAPSAVAQLPQTRLYSLYPPGIAPGQITDVRINSGADLDEVDRLIVNHPGIFATQKMQPDGMGGFNPVANTFRVAVEDDVPPGRYEVRAAGLFGVSNPRALIIDQRPAVNEVEPNNTAEQAQAIDIGTLVDGQINGAGDLDYVRVAAKQGQRLVIDCLAERIDTKLNPMLTLSNADDKPIAFARNEYGRDAFLVYDVPADGDYFIKLQDETFAGSGEFIYRLQVHTGPHIRFVMPPAGQPRATGKFALYGYNLPGSQRVEAVSAQAPLEKLDVDIAAPAEGVSTYGIPSVAAGLDLFSYRYRSDAGFSNQVMLGLAKAPVTLEVEPNDELAAAQKLTPPFEVAGQSSHPGDIDRYSFEAAKDQELWIEVIAHRGGAMLDPFLNVEQVTVDGDGNERVKTLATQDDTGTNLAANVFDTAHDDPAWKFKAPENGTYRLTVVDRASSSRGDPSYVYRLIARPVQPDFRLVAVAAGQMSGQAWPVGLRQGDHFALTVMAFRRDDFEGTIEVRPVELPAGVTTQGTFIREKENTAVLVLTASESAATDLSTVRLVGSATVTTPQGESTIERPVRSGGVVWNRNGNTPAISQLESQLTSTVVPEEAPYQLTFEFPKTNVHQGRQLLIPMTLIKRGFNEKLTMKFDGTAKKAKVDVADVVFEKDQGEKLCRLYVRPDAPPGIYVLGGESQTQVPYRRNPQKAAQLSLAHAIALQEAERAKQAAEAAAGRANAQATVVQESDAALKHAQAAQTGAQEKVTQAQQALTEAKQASDAAAKQVAALSEETKQLTAKLEEANEAAADGDDEGLKAQAEEARNAVDEKRGALQSAQDAQAKMQEQVKQAEAAVKPAMDALTAAQQATAAAQAALTFAQQKQARLDAASQAAAALAKAKDDARAAAEKASNDANKAAEPKNVAVNQPIPPLILTIKPAPVSLDAKPAKGDIRNGETIDVTVTVKRQNEYAGPVKLSLAVPPGVAGLSAAEINVPPDAESGVLKVAATAEAAEGDIANLVVRAKMDAGGEAIVDAPLALKVTK